MNELIQLQGLISADEIVIIMPCRILEEQTMSLRLAFKFQGSIITRRVSILKFLEFVQKDERDNSILIMQLMGGHRRIRHSIKKKRHR
jgi:hypothetical protein